MALRHDDVAGRRRRADRRRPRDLAVVVALPRRRRGRRRARRRGAGPALLRPPRPLADAASRSSSRTPRGRRSPSACRRPRASSRSSPRPGSRVLPLVTRISVAAARDRVADRPVAGAGEVARRRLGRGEVEHVGLGRALARRSWRADGCRENENATGVRPHSPVGMAMFVSCVFVAPGLHQPQLEPRRRGALASRWRAHRRCREAPRPGTRCVPVLVSRRVLRARRRGRVQVDAGVDGARVDDAVGATGLEARAVERAGRDLLRWSATPCRRPTARPRRSRRRRPAGSASPPTTRAAA